MFTCSYPALWLAKTSSASETFGFYWFVAKLSDRDRCQLPPAEFPTPHPPAQPSPPRGHQLSTQAGNRLFKRQGASRSSDGILAVWRDRNLSRARRFHFAGNLVVANPPVLGHSKVQMSKTGG